MSYSDSTKLDRRQVLQGLAALAGATVAFTPESRAAAAEIQQRWMEELSLADVSWGKAPCRYCGTGCGVEVGVSQGKVVAVRGDVLSPVNRGLLCAKGYHLPGLLYGADRLRQPLRRMADGSTAPISWDEALDLIAGKFRETLDSQGPDAVAVYGSGQWTVFDGYAALKWVKAGMRSNNLEANARLCMASAVMGFMTQFQSDEPMGCYDDFELADDFLLWGNNMAETHPVLFSRLLERRRNEPGTRIVDIATRHSVTTNFADLHVRFAPGTDTALANGILHLLLSDKGGFARAFVEENVVFRRGIEDAEVIGYGCFGDDAERYVFRDEARESSLDDFRKQLAAYTPAAVSEITGVPAAQIKSLAEIYANQRRNTVSLWCMGVNQHVRGTWMNNLINNIHLLTGKIARPGSNPLSLTGQPSACGTVREVGTLCNRLPSDMVVENADHRAKAEHIWKLPAGTINPVPGYHTVDMFRAFARGDIKALWVQTTNPWASLPHLSRYRRTPGDGRFLVVSEIYPTPTTAVADLILPSAAWVEREGIFGNTERRTQHWDKLIDPPGEAREDAWQIMAVAKRMGMGNLFPWSDDDWHRPMYEEYRQFTVGHGKDLATYDQLRASRGLRWPVVDGVETRYRYAAGHDPYVEKRTGVHFYKAKGYGEKAAVWFRPHHPPAEVPDEQYPFWLSTGRVLEHWHTGTMTRRTPELHRAAPSARLSMNRVDVTRLGLQDGKPARVSSRRGSVTALVEVDPRGEPPTGSVFLTFFDEDVLVNFVTLDAMDSISKEPDYKKCAVRIEAA